jgi:TPR repeat protein
LPSGLKPTPGLAPDLTRDSSSRLPIGGPATRRLSVGELQTPLVRRGLAMGLRMLGGDRFWSGMAMADLRRMAKGGNPEAQAALAWRLAGRVGREVQATEALQWALRSAESESAMGCAVLGWLLRRGIGTPCDAAEAGRLYERAAAGGSPLACRELGYMQLDAGGKGAATAAIEWFRRGSALGDAESAYELGECMAQGIGTPRPDAGAAIGLWRSAAATGHARAHLRLAHAFRLGEGVRLDLAQAADWYRRAAGLGLAEAWVWLGEMLEHGLSGRVDRAGARRAYRHAAEQGDAHGRGEYGRCLLHGIGGSADPARGCAELEAALAQGWEPARADLERHWHQAALDLLHAASGPDDPGLGEAVRLLRRAAESGSQRSAWLLGQCLQHGSGAAADAVQALYWYRRAGRLVDAQLAIADMLYFGRGVAMDRGAALAWYRRAATEHEDLHAMYSLGFCLLHGQGQAADVAAGIRWLERAARQDEANAAWELARHFLGGGRRQARRGSGWLRRAATLGHGGAKRMLAALTVSASGAFPRSPAPGWPPSLPAGRGRHGRPGARR